MNLVSLHANIHVTIDAVPSDSQRYTPAGPGQSLANGLMS